MLLYLVTSVTVAANIKSYEDYTGKRTYSITYTKSSSILSFNNHYKITTIFNSIYEKDSTLAVKKITLKYYSDQNDIILIRPTINFIIDDKPWRVSSTANCTINSDGVIQFSWVIPDDVVKSFMETEKAILVRFFYNTPEGDRFRDYTIPYKTIELVQSMYLQKIEPVNSILTE